MAPNQINRRKALTVVAAAPVAVALPAFASAEEDAELRELWAKYRVTLAAHRSAEHEHEKRRDAVDAELGPKPWGWGLDDRYTKIWESCCKKHGVGPVYDEWCREGRKLRRIVKAIRKAKAESLFGIGVKLSVVEDPSPLTLDADDYADAILDALRAIEDLTGADFVAASGVVEEWS